VSLLPEEEEVEEEMGSIEGEMTRAIFR